MRVSQETARWYAAGGRVFAIFALLFATLLASGCGGGGDDPQAAPPDPPAPPAPPPPPPPPANNLPPLAATPISLDEDHRIGTGHWPVGDTSDGGQGQPVGTYNCGIMDETYHVHSHVSIFLNGEQLLVPFSIGIVEQRPGVECFYALHTHDASGKIHVEGPAPASFTVGHLFAIWGQPLARDNVGGLSGMPVVVYIVDDKGVLTQYDGDIAAIELKSHHQITIQVGTPITEIPTYTWAGT